MDDTTTHFCVVCFVTLIFYNENYFDIIRLDIYDIYVFPDNVLTRESMEQESILIAYIKYWICSINSE